MRGHTSLIDLQSTRAIMADKYAVEYCPFTANAIGIEFYEGLAKLHSMMNVRVKRESENVHVANAIVVELKSGEMLGHLEKRYARVLAPIMDSHLPGLVRKCLVGSEVRLTSAWDFTRSTCITGKKFSISQEIPTNIGLLMFLLLSTFLRSQN